MTGGIFHGLELLYAVGGMHLVIDDVVCFPLERRALQIRDEVAYGPNVSSAPLNMQK